MNKLTIVSILLIFTGINGYGASVEYSNAARSQTTVDNAHPTSFAAGDAIEIITFPDTLAFPSGVYLIDGEGYVDFPIIGYLKVINMTPNALTALLAEKYVDYMRYPLMSVRPVIRVAFQGGFFQPGLYWVSPNMSLWDALKIAGGTQRTDGCRKLRWERSNKIVSNNLVSLLEEGKSLYQIGFKSGDQITVLQQPYRTKWEIFRTDILPMLTTSVSLFISVMTLFLTSQYYKFRY